VLSFNEHRGLSAARLADLSAKGGIQHQVSSQLVSVVIVLNFVFWLFGFVSDLEIIRFVIS